MNSETIALGMKVRRRTGEDTREFGEVVELDAERRRARVLWTGRDFQPGQRYQGKTLTEALTVEYGKRKGSGVNSYVQKRTWVKWDNLTAA